MKKTALLILFFCSLTNLVGQSDSAANLVRTQWGVGMEFGPCTGWFFVTGEAERFIQGGRCYTNLGVFARLKKLEFNLRLGGLSGSIKEDLSYSADWKKGNRMGSVNLHLALGYALVSTRFFDITPYVSLGATAFNTGPDSIAANPYSTNFRFGYTLGSAFDVKLNLPVSKKRRELVDPNEEKFVALRVLTGIAPTYFVNPLNVKGCMYFVNLGLVGYFGNTQLSSNPDHAAVIK